VLNIFVDADGCPVKQDIYRVAGRYGLKVVLVTNTWMRTPAREQIELVVVGEQFDAADHWIVEHVGENDIVISSDIPLASRCLEKGALVLTPTGRRFTEDNIGEALSTRELMSQLREGGVITGGPAPFGKRNRSRFLRMLDETIQSVRRKLS
jgi:uncharacterized protein YaiI (UPF0178 family)